MVRRDIVTTKVGRARAWLNDAATTLLSPTDAFLSDQAARDLSLFYLFLAIQECIDLAAHWVADEGWGEADDAGSAFDVLADRLVIDSETATALRGAAGLRNRIGHGTHCSTINVCGRKPRLAFPHSAASSWLSRPPPACKIKSGLQRQGMRRLIQLMRVRSL